MYFNSLELEMILAGLRKERERATQDYVESLKQTINKTHYDTDKVCIGVADSLQYLQRFNNLIIKCEDELRKEIKSNG